MEIIASAIFGRSSFTFGLNRIIRCTWSWAALSIKQIYKHALEANPWYESRWERWLSRGFVFFWNWGESPGEGGGERYLVRTLGILSDIVEKNRESWSQYWSLYFNCELTSSSSSTHQTITLWRLKRSLLRSSVSWVKSTGFDAFRCNAFLATVRCVRGFGDFFFIKDGDCFKNLSRKQAKPLDTYARSQSSIVFGFLGYSHSL